MSDQYCYLCSQILKDEEIIECTVVAEYMKIPSRIAFKLGKPMEVYLDTLRHNKCPEDSDEYQV